MFANAFQSGFISIFYSVGSAPLSIWNKEVKNGHIRRIVDEEVKSLVLEISGTNVATTYITCPQKPRASLAIKLPFLVMIIKNMKKYFTFEIQILDDKDIRRRFRVSNFQSTTKVRPFCTTMPIGLSDGWNQVQFNLADFTKRAYGSTYLETVRVQVHANVRIRRIYFSDTLYSEDEMPNEFRLFLPTAASKAKAKEKERGKIEKKPVAKAPVPEQVPSGAPPSPAEGARSSSEGGAMLSAEEPEIAKPEELTAESEAPTHEEPTTEEVVGEVVEAPVEEAAPIEGEVSVPPESNIESEGVVIEEMPNADIEGPAEIVAESAEVQGEAEVSAVAEIIDTIPPEGEQEPTQPAVEEQVQPAGGELEAVPPTEEGDIDKSPAVEEAPVEEVPVEVPTDAPPEAPPEVPEEVPPAE